MSINDRLQASQLKPEALSFWSIPCFPDPRMKTLTSLDVFHTQFIWPILPVIGGRMVSFLSSLSLRFRKHPFSIQCPWTDSHILAAVSYYFHLTSSSGAGRGERKNWTDGNSCFQNYNPWALCNTCWERLNPNIQYLVLPLSRCDGHLPCPSKWNRTPPFEEQHNSPCHPCGSSGDGFILSPDHRNDHMDQAGMIRSFRAFFSGGKIKKLWALLLPNDKVTSHKEC